MRELYFKLLRLIPKPIRDVVPVDKLAHIVAGGLIAAPFWFAGEPVHGLIAAAIAGFGKELIDHINNRKAEKAGLKPPHSVELLDAIATVAGGFAVYQWMDDAVALIQRILG